MYPPIPTGAGQQRYGVYVNLGAFYCAAIPLALVLAFWMQLGVSGMYWGMLCGPIIQAFAYGGILTRLDWRTVARKAHARASAKQ